VSGEFCGEVPVEGDEEDDGNGHTVFGSSLTLIFSQLIDVRESFPDTAKERAFLWDAALLPLPGESLMEPQKLP
jgi:hypothetical protein